MTEQNTNYTNRLLCGDSAQILKTLPDNLVDLTVTSPPYDDLRDYDGYMFDFETIAKELLRVTKQGGIVVWIVNDKTIDGSESGTSFKQVLYFMNIGFKLHDTMLYAKNPRFTESVRYNQAFEYMFVLSKGIPKTVNLIKDKKNKWARTFTFSKVSNRLQNGELVKKSQLKIKEFGNRPNIWFFDNAYLKGSKDLFILEHPATFPEDLVIDHIMSWSNKGDLVLDPFAGSGTTLKAAKIRQRDYLGIEISPKYCKIIEKRLEKYNNQSIEVFCN